MQNENTKFIPRTQMQTILDNAPEGVDKNQLINKFVSNGYKVEGVNDKPEPNIAQSFVGDLVSGPTNLSNTLLAGVGTLGEVVGKKLAGEDTSFSQAYQNQSEKIRQGGGSGVSQVVTGQNVRPAENLEQFAGDALQTGAILMPQGTIAKAAISGASLLGGAAMSEDKSAQEVAQQAIIGGVGGAVITGIVPGLQKLAGLSKGIKKEIEENLLKGIKGEDIAAQILTKQVRLTPTQRSTFSDMSNGLDEGQYLVQKGIYEPNEQAIKTLGDDWLKSYNEKKTALGQLTNQYTFAPVNEALKELVDYEAKTAVKGTKGLFTDRINQLSKAAEKRGLTLNEIDDLKNAYERTVALGYGKEVNTIGTARATKIDNALRTFLEVEAEKQGFTNVKELNKNTQLSRFLANAIEDRVGSRAGNNFVGLSDTIMATGAVVDPSALALLAVKKTLGAEAVQSKIAKYLGKTVPTDIKAKVEQSTPALLNEKSAPKTDFYAAPAGSRPGQFESATKKIAISGLKKTQATPQVESQLLSPLKESISQTKKGATKSVEKSIPKELQPLAEEAKKFPTADEFVKAQGTPVYHGTNAKFDTFDPKKINSIEGKGDYVGEGFYFTTSKDTAKKYATQAVKKGGGAENIKEVYLDIKNPFTINTKADIKKLNDIFGGEEARLELLMDNPKAVSNKLKALGYDGLIDNLYGQRAVFSPDQIKSKEQLKVVWDKINKN